MNVFENRLNLLLLLGVIGTTLLFNGCYSPDRLENIEQKVTGNTWKKQFEEKLPFLGHRNWILVVDKAFPEQNAPGMEYLYADEDLLPVLKSVLEKVRKSGHVKPIIYQDKELGFITESQAKGVPQFRQELSTLFNGQNVQTMLHDSVFKKLDSEAKLFKVLVIKTNQVIPYTSIFLQLDCDYWNGDKEKELRNRMKLPL